jgi:hypothetical protein
MQSPRYVFSARVWQLSLLTAILQLADSYTEILREITHTELKSIGNYTIQRLLGEGKNNLLLLHFKANLS